MPEISRFIPLLVYEDIARAHDFLVDAFGFVPGGLERNSEGTVIHAEVNASDFVIWLHRITPEHQLVAATSLPGSAGGLVVHVADVEAHYRRARNKGAQIVSELADQPYGQREYGARDLGGHRWWFAQPSGASG